LICHLHLKMPKSKRDQRLTLTKTKRKRGIELKQQLISKIHSNLDKYSSLYLLKVYNERNEKLHHIRQHFSDSQFFFGKNRVMSIALGRTPNREYLTNLSKITPYLLGKIGLMLTNRDKREIVEYFNSLSLLDYARSGNVATEAVTIEQGALPDFQHTMEPMLRQLGLMTSLKKGIIGDVLTPEQAKLLKFFQYQQSEFKVRIKAIWTKDDGNIQAFEIPDDEKDVETDDDGMKIDDIEEQTIPNDDEEWEDDEAKQTQRKTTRNKRRKI
ncbi:unnamed protein product, partial [Didymodactylos carnosus]